MFKPMLLLFITIITTHPVFSMETIVDRPKSTSRGLVIIAPAKKYLMRERLFSELAANLSKHGYIVVRFNWSPNTLTDPKLELQRAAKDIKTVTMQAQKYFGFHSGKTVLISKSFSTKAIRPSLSLVKTNILLTPNCSSEEPFYEAYGDILALKDVTNRIIISKNDPFCSAREIDQALRQMAKLPLLTLTQGDHNFVVTNTKTGQHSYEYQNQIIQFITRLLL